jgi:hypothetical protein
VRRVVPLLLSVLTIACADAELPPPPEEADDCWIDRVQRDRAAAELFEAHGGVYRGQAFWYQSSTSAATTTTTGLTLKLARISSSEPSTTCSRLSDHALVSVLSDDGKVDQTFRASLERGPIVRWNYSDLSGNGPIIRGALMLSEAGPAFFDLDFDGLPLRAPALIREAP